MARFVIAFAPVNPSAKLAKFPILKVSKSDPLLLRLAALIIASKRVGVCPVTPAGQFVPSGRQPSWRFLMAMLKESMNPAALIEGWFKS